DASLGAPGAPGIPVEITALEVRVTGLDWAFSPMARCVPAAARGRASAAALIPRTRAHRHPGEIGVRYRAEVEIAGAGCHAGERLGERHRRGRVALLRLVDAHRVYSVDDVVAQVRGLEANIPPCGDYPHYAPVH